MRLEALTLLLLACAQTDSKTVLSTPDPKLPDADAVAQDLGPMAAVDLTVDPPGATFVEPIEVRLVSPDPQAVIWYTDDGSVPVPGQSSQYQGPLTVTASTQIRATTELFGGYLSEATAVFLQLEPWAETYRSNLPQLVLW